MHVDRRFLNWGVFLIAAGAVPLAVRAGLVPAGVRWWELWPLLLVGWGIGLLLGRTVFGLLGGALVAAAIGIVVGGVLSSGSGFGGFAAGCGRDSGTAFQAQTGTFTGDRATVQLDGGCGRLDVSVGGTSWEVSGATRDGAVPPIDASPAALRIESGSRGFDPFGTTGTGSLQVRLPENQAIDLSVTANGGTARLGLAKSTLGQASLTVNGADTRADFTGAALARLSVTANAGNARLTLPAASLTGSLTANAGSIALCVPAGTGVRIDMSGSVLGGNNFEQRGLAHDGDSWTTSGYASATARIQLSATANAGSITLDPEGGCG
jgi:hypothetical protein